VKVIRMFKFMKPKTQAAPAWVALAVEAARSQIVDPTLFVALILNESSGDPMATRWERRFYIRYISDRPLDQLTRNVVRELDSHQDQTFRHCLAYSWGLCQIMGVVAYENGFRGRHPWELLDPETNVKLGAQIFASRLGKIGNSEPKLGRAEIERRALLAYNGGGDAEYPDRVLKRLPAAKELILRCG
jgi:soluble lytic murein transglycosylase-like protein